MESEKFLFTLCKQAVFLSSINTSIYKTLKMQLVRNVSEKNEPPSNVRKPPKFFYKKTAKKYF